jgi:tetratricopeptide (TPR) repeat protein
MMKNEPRENHDDEPVAQSLEEFFRTENQTRILSDSDRTGETSSQEMLEGKKPKLKYFGDYELIEEIARGGMGVVYKAKQVRLGRIVALKMILTGNFASREQIARFHTEAQAAASLNHPGIVPIFEIGNQDHQYYFSMAFIEGESLQHIVKRGPIAPLQAASITRKIALAIAYAHSKGIIHRDLKPANVLIDTTGEPKVTDFGLARRIANESELTNTGIVLGTPSFMPPEQASGSTGLIGPPADIYSLGATLYCLITGTPPFLSDSPIATIKQVLEQEATPPRKLNKKIPKDLETICMKCLHKKTENRYASASLLAEDLQRFIDDEPILAKRTEVRELVWRKLRKHPQSIAVIALLTLILCCIPIFWGLFFNSTRIEEINSSVLSIEKKIINMTLQDADKPSINSEIDQLAQLDEKQSEHSKQKYFEKIEKLFNERFNTLRITDEERELLTRLRDRLIVTVGFRSDTVNQKLNDIQSLWLIGHDISSKRGDSKDLLSNQLSSNQNNNWVNQKPNEILFTNIPVSNHERIELEFELNERSKSAVGIIVRFDGEQEYRWMLVPEDRGKAKQIISEDPDREGIPVASGDFWELQLWKNSTLLRTASLGKLKPTTAPHVLIATKENGKLLAQFSAGISVEFEDVFPLTSDKNGNLALIVGSSAEIVSLRTKRIQIVGDTSWMVSGDRLFEAGQWKNAIDTYETVLTRLLASDPESRHEVLYKLGLCHMRNKDLEKSKEYLTPVAAQANSKWFIPATVYLWLASVRQKNRPEALILYQRLSTISKWKQVAKQIPAGVFDEILAFYETKDFGTMDSLVFLDKSKQRIQEMKVYEDLLDSFDADSNRNFQRGLRLAFRYLLLDQAGLALDVLKRLKSNSFYFLSDEPTLIECLALGYSASGHEILSTLSAIEHSSNPNLSMNPLIQLTRAKALRSIGDSPGCLQVLDNLCAIRDQDNLPYDRVYWQGAREDSKPLRSLPLLKGLTLEEDGRLAEAMKEWNECLDVVTSATSKKALFLHIDDSMALLSLTDRLTKEHCRPMAKRILDTQLPVVNAFKGSFSEELVADTFAKAWMSPRGKQLARDMSWNKIPFAQKSEKIMQLASFQYLTDALYSGMISGQYEQDFFDYCGRTIRLGSQYDLLGVSSVVALYSAWTGNSGVLGWAGIENRIDKELRGYLSYALARRSIQIGKLMDARTYFVIASKDLDPNCAMYKYIDDELALTTARKSRFRFFNNQSKPVELVITSDSQTLVHLVMPGDSHLDLPSGRILIEKKVGDSSNRLFDHDAIIASTHTIMIN